MMKEEFAVPFVSSLGSDRYGISASSVQWDFHLTCC